MTFKTHCEIAKGRIDPVPMMNVVFLLVIFLMLNSPYVLQPGIGTVVLPSVKSAPNATWQGVVVTVARNNLLFFNDQVTTIEGLQRSLQEAAQKSRNQGLIIRADQEVPYGRVVQIMSMAVEAGFSVVNQATRPEIARQLAPK
jgi:biopolymer transport protein ExbD